MFTTFHARMPVLSPMALRRLGTYWCLPFAVLAGSAAHLLGPGLPGVLAFVGGGLATQLVAEVALRRWARQRRLPLVPRRNWEVAAREANRAAPVPALFFRALLFGLVIAQIRQERPFWALDVAGWLVVTSLTVVLFLVLFWDRGMAAADAWRAARQGSTEPKRDPA